MKWFKRSPCGLSGYFSLSTEKGDIGGVGHVGVGWCGVGHVGVGHAGVEWAVKNFTE